jgi:hypothetical protein
LVSINNNPSHPYIHIQLLDGFFKKVFFLEHIRYIGIYGYKKLDQYKDPLLRKLIEKIATEVEKEVTQNYAVVKNLLSYLK